MPEDTEKMIHTNLIKYEPDIRTNLMSGKIEGIEGESPSEETKIVFIGGKHE